MDFANQPEIIDTDMWDIISINYPSILSTMA